MSEADTAEDASPYQEIPFRLSEYNDATLNQLEGLFHGISLSQRVVLGGDLNGNAGEKHLVTYRSGRSATRIDYNHIGKAANCKVIPVESLTAKYRLLVIDLCDKCAGTNGEYVQDGSGRIQAAIIRAARLALGVSKGGRKRDDGTTQSRG